MPQGTPRGVRTILALDSVAHPGAFVLVPRLIMVFPFLVFLTQGSTVNDEVRNGKYTSFEISFCISMIS
jgi:hypothetical protein